MKEGKIKGARPSENYEDAMSSIDNKKTVTKRKSVKKNHVQKYDYDLEVDVDWIAYKNYKGWIKH